MKLCESWGTFRDDLSVVGQLQKTMSTWGHIHTTLTASKTYLVEKSASSPHLISQPLDWCSSRPNSGRGTFRTHKGFVHVCSTIVKSSLYAHLQRPANGTPSLEDVFRTEEHRRFWPQHQKQRLLFSISKETEMTIVRANSIPDLEEGYRWLSIEFTYQQSTSLIPRLCHPNSKFANSKKEIKLTHTNALW